MYYFMMSFRGLFYHDFNETNTAVNCIHTFPYYKINLFVLNNKVICYMAVIKGNIIKTNRSNRYSLNIIVFAVFARTSHYRR